MGILVTAGTQPALMVLQQYAGGKKQGAARQALQDQAAADASMHGHLCKEIAEHAWCG